MRGQGTSMRHTVGKLDCKVKERKWKQACFMMDVFPREGAMSHRGPRASGWYGFLGCVFLVGGSKVVANGSLNRGSRIWRATSFSVVMQNPKSI